MGSYMAIETIAPNPNPTTPWNPITTSFLDETTIIINKQVTARQF